MALCRNILKTKGLHRVAAPVYVALFALSIATPVVAQDTAQTESTAAPSLSLSEGLNFNLPASSDFTATTGTQLNLPGNAVGSTLFKLDLSDPACITGTGACVSRNGRIDLGLSDTFTAKSKKGLDLSLKPRAAMQFDDGNSSALVGAVIEIGEDLRTGSDLKNDTWYFFAGADAEALNYAPNSVSRITSGQFHLQDRIIVGDAQAGLGYRIGYADVSLSYMRREATAEDFKITEDAAALSFTWKR